MRPAREGAMNPRACLLLSLMALVACGEDAHFRFAGPARTPRAAWQPASDAPKTTPDDALGTDPPGLASRPLPELPPATEDRLPNGVRLLAVERHALPIVAIRVL